VCERENDTYPYAHRSIEREMKPGARVAGVRGKSVGSTVVGIPNAAANLSKALFTSFPPVYVFFFDVFVANQFEYQTPRLIIYEAPTRFL